MKAFNGIDLFAISTGGQVRIAERYSSFTAGNWNILDWKIFVSPQLPPKPIICRPKRPWPVEHNIPKHISNKNVNIHHD